MGLLALKHIFSDEPMEHLPGMVRLLTELSSEPVALACLRRLLLYVASAGEGLTESEIQEALENVFGEEGGGTMSTLVEQWLERGHQQGLQQGLRQGLDEGLQRGMLTEARELVLQVVRIRFGVVPSHMEGLMNRIESRMTLNSLHEQAIRCDTLADFQKALGQAVETQD